MMRRELLQSRLSYDADTGLFVWLESPRAGQVGKVAGTLDRSTGYLRISIDNRIFYAHRLAWLYVHGVFPLSQIDHINRCRTDNRLANLREATPFDNGANLSRKVNNTSGVPGVSRCGRSGKWVAYINRGGKKFGLGEYGDFLDAVCARKSAESRVFGQFAARL